MSDQLCSHPVYTYISTKAGYDPAKTYYVCAPERNASDVDNLAKFAAASGWDTLPPTLFMDIYGQTRNKFHSRSGKAPWGRQGSLWCWETVIYLAGYEEGAEFAGKALVKCPNMFAATALVDGVLIFLRETIHPAICSSKT